MVTRDIVTRFGEVVVYWTFRHLDGAEQTSIMPKRKKQRCEVIAMQDRELELEIGHSPFIGRGAWLFVLKSLYFD